VSLFLKNYYITSFFYRGVLCVEREDTDHLDKGSMNIPEAKKVFELSGIPDEELSRENVMRAFRKGALKWHPDKHEQELKNNSALIKQFNEEFNKVTDARIVLEKYLRKQGRWNNKDHDSSMKATAKVIDGGIDLNAKKMDLDVAKDGKGVEMQFEPAMVAEFRKGNFTGVEGVILNIVPIASPLFLLGLEANPTGDQLAKG